MDQQEELLTNLIEFYKRKFPGNFKDKFDNAIADLITTGDVTRITYINFCTKHDIDPKIKIGVTTTSRYNTSSC